MVAHLGCVFGVMRGMTLHLVKVLILKRDMSRQTGYFQYTKNISKFGYDPKERHDYTLVKRLDPKESHGSFYWQCIGPNESHVRNERHVSLFKHQRVPECDFKFQGRLLKKS